MKKKNELSKCCLISMLALTVSAGMTIMVMWLTVFF